MTLHSDMTIPQFRDHMQMLVIKYHPRSRIVKEAVRFARLREDPTYYRIAIEKVHAQEQFRREAFGPTWGEWVSELLNVTSMRDVAFTLVLVAVAIGGIELVKSRWNQRPYPATADVDVERLAERMGFYINDEVKAPTIERLDKRVSEKIDAAINDARIQEAVAQQLQKHLVDFEKQLAERTTKVQDQIATAIAEAVKNAKLEQVVISQIESAINKTKVAAVGTQPPGAVTNPTAMP